MGDYAYLTIPGTRETNSHTHGLTLRADRLVDGRTECPISAVTLSLLDGSGPGLCTRVKIPQPAGYRVLPISFSWKGR